MKINYRKIYEQHYGPIPKDKDGRSYEIHHIDGNHNNDSPENLIAVTIQEHYNIHYAQCDWGACYYILMRMRQTPKEISKICSELATKNALLRIVNGTHNFLSGDTQKRTQLKLVENGTHHFLTNNPGNRAGNGGANKGKKYKTDKTRKKRIAWNKGLTLINRKKEIKETT